MKWDRLDLSYWCHSSLMKRHMPKNGYQDKLAMLYSPQTWHTAPCHTKPACGDEVCAAWRKVVLELDCGNLCLNRLAGSRSYYLTNVAYLSIVAYNYTKYYEQMRPLATLALHCVTGWESLACHRHLAGSSWAMLAAWAVPVGQRWLDGAFTLVFAIHNMQTQTQTCMQQQ